MDSYILCGMQFGDEGKGTFVDYLVYFLNADSVVRYNGGSQASHTVITPEKTLHKFSQLGSGMFLEKCHTYLTENMVINLENLMHELEVFSRKSDISISDLLDRLHIHEECFVVTPYHKLINKLRELSKGNDRRGSVGTGVSEVRYLLSEPKQFPYDPPLGLQVKDIFNPYSNNPSIGRLEALKDYVEDFYQKHEKVIWKNVPENYQESLEIEINILLKSKGFLGSAINYITKFKNAPNDLNFKRCLYNNYESTLRKQSKCTIFEGSQGLLIDGTFGIKPNTTFLDTTNNFALDISYYRDNIQKVGIAKAFCSRHGFGVFPTEDFNLSKKISDENQVETFWNGSIRFGWFDVVLLKYAQMINQVDTLYLSSLDKLDNFEKIKVCTSYIYNGTVDDNFKDIFEYSTDSTGLVIINSIKKSDINLGKYLKRCSPYYTSIDGWMYDISGITSPERLPEKCLKYIELLEKLTEIPISVISVGPTRENKIIINSK